MNTEEKVDMVDLELDTTPAETTTTTQTAARTPYERPENKFCRLCLEESELVANLFEEQQDAENLGNVALSEKLFDLFHIKYEKTPSLPNSICKQCLYMIDSFTAFRENVHKIESELQKRIASLKFGGVKIMEDMSRPGLNGAPGIFVPEEDAIIIEVNPEEDFESSDDEFSMDSDSEDGEEASQNETLSPEKSSSSINVQKDNLLATGQSAFSTDANKSNTNQSTASRCIESTFLTSSNIIEKSYTMEGVPPQTTYSCQYCDMAFTEQKECAEHVETHDPTGPFVCSFCTTRFTSRQHLITHIREQHGNNRPYVCTLCTKGFVRRSDLRKHTIVHTGLRPYVCNVCGKSFSRNTNLTKHIRIHSSVRPHVCTRCPRSFVTSAELARHTRTHAVNKPFHCTRCTASFTRRDKLVQHEHVHLRRDAEATKYPTDNSGGSNIPLNQHTPSTVVNQQQMQQQQQQMQQQQFMQQQQQMQQQLMQQQQMQQNLQNQLPPLNPYAGSTDQGTIKAPLSTASSLINTGDPYRQSILAAQLQQPLALKLSLPSLPPPPMIPALPKQSHFSRHFVCEICSQTFARERDYQRHQALHLDLLFTCKQCGMGFSRREKLARHELEQHAPTYPCNICRIPFTKVSDYELHMKMHELQQSVTMTAQAASLLSAGNSQGIGMNSQQQLQPLQQQQPKTLLPSAPKDFLSIPQRPSAADMTFYSQMVPTMNLGFYSETRPEDRNGI